MRKGEVVIKFFTSSYSKDGYEINDLFKLALPEKMSIREAKTEIIKHFNELQKSEETKKPFEIGDEDHFRLRELFFRCPSSIFLDTATVKEAARLFSPELAVENIPNGEIKVKGNIVIFIQQFFPSRYEVGDVHEISTTNDEELDGLRKRITELTGCKNVVLTIGERWESCKLMNIYSLYSFKPSMKGTDEKEESSDDEDEYLRSKGINIKKTTSTIYSVRRLNCRDGEIVYFWDNSEELKKLTDEEKRALILKERALKGKTRYRDREESLHIKEKDVNIEDE